ncbi:MAG: PTS sugar transporter subunit IIA [Candidatus Omnitrophica bacterium]|nr:PTS sugar transporter subunit IIA [Candidatus Omnitrophota bacterium]
MKLESCLKADKILLDLKAKNKEDAIKEITLVLKDSKSVLDFDSLDNKPTKLIFLMGISKNKEVGSYLKILAYLTRLLDKESFRNVLLGAEKPTDVIEGFRRAEKY